MGNIFLLAADGIKNAAAEATPTPIVDRIFGLDGQLIADTIILALAVFVLFFALSYLLFNPARQLLKARQDFVASELSKAELDKIKADKYKKEYDAKLKQVDKEAEELLSAARKKAIKRENDIINEAKEEASRILDRAMKEIELEKNKVQSEVRQEMITVASVMASKFVAVSLDENKQNQLIEEALKEMGDATWQS